MQPLSRPVKLLGYTSLFTDAATEAIYPLLPVFVTQVLHGNPAALGVIEGAADATSSILKLVAGRWSDRTGKRKPFVLAGYAVAGLVRPLIALATIWQHVFVIRVADRVGKGLRGAPRDAMLGALAPEGQRGRVFGYHRAMDHLGAVIGPLLAAAFLYFYPGEYRTLFALTIIPGLLAIGMLLLVPERSGGSGGSGGPGRSGGSGGSGHEESAEFRHQTEPPDQTDPPYLTHLTDPTHQTDQTDQPDQPDPTDQTKPVPPELKRFLLILTVFTLGNSADAFLLLRLSDAGLATPMLPLAWAGLHVVKASLSTYGGTLSDRLGRKHLIVAGWLLYAIVYAGFALTASVTPLLAWFFTYGLYFALVEGSEKALIADLVPVRSQGTAFGWYNAVLGFGSLGASLLFGALWQTFGAATAFFTGAALAVTASALLAAVSTTQPASRS